MEQNSHGRLVGIDALRVLAMLMIPALHLLGAGGLMRAVAPGTVGLWSVRVLEALCYCAVNCYGLISGYVSSGRRHPLKRLGALWLQVFTYGAVITVVFALVLPGSLRVRDMVAPFIPVVNGTYWYFTAFFYLYLLMPFLDMILAALDRKGAARLVGALVLLYSVFACLAPEDILGSRSGYSLGWLAALYLMGGVLRRFPPEKAPRPGLCVAGYFACCAVGLLGKHAMNAITYRLLGQSMGGSLLLGYTSVPILLASVFLLLALRDWQPPRPVAAVISFCAPLSFGVYLLHTHPLTWTWLLTGATIPLAALPGPLPGLAAAAAAVGVFLLGIAADFLRVQLFRAVAWVFRRARCRFVSK